MGLAADLGLRARDDLALLLLRGAAGRRVRGLAAGFGLSRFSSAWPT